MPKERFHILLADEYLRASGTLPRVLRTERLAFFLGAISPDIFFYDLPSFSLSGLGDRLHRLMETEGLSLVHGWLADLHRAPTAAEFAWGLGFSSHILADAVWHPTINALGGSYDVCSEKNLSALGCHRLVESEMEAHWLPRRGVSGGYLDVLKWFGSDLEWLGRMGSIYSDFLHHAGLGRLPPQSRIRRCFLVQNFLLRLFSQPVLGRQRNRLLGSRLGRYFGSLIVPERPFLTSGPLSGVPADRDPFSEQFMNSRFTSLSARLADFAQQLSPYLPS